MSFQKGTREGEGGEKGEGGERERGRGRKRGRMEKEKEDKGKYRLLHYEIRVAP